MDFRLTQRIVDVLLNAVTLQSKSRSSAFETHCFPEFTRGTVEYIGVSQNDNETKTEPVADIEGGLSGQPSIEPNKERSPPEKLGSSLG